jgi:uncharacterized protein with HEPN domain
MKSPRGDRFRLQDILDAIDVVIRCLPAQRSAFDADPMLQSHVLRHVIIVGEATFRLSRELKGRNPNVPWDKIEGMRHILVHDYFKVDWDIVYATARTDVPALKPQIEAILASLPA